MVVYHKGSIFDAPEGTVLAHACNCQGVWGSGIAAEFKKGFPKAFDVYNVLCKGFQKDILGKIVLAPYEHGHYIACLMTSFNYGKKVDPPEMILENTRKALNQLVATCGDTDICMPLINAGLFRVPWKDTEKLLNSYSKIFHIYVLESQWHLISSQEQSNSSSIQ